MGHRVKPGLLSLMGQAHWPLTAGVARSHVTARAGRCGWNRVPGIDEETDTARSDGRLVRVPPRATR